MLPVLNNPFCETTDWGSWSECSSTCGPGLRMRTRRFHNSMGRKRCPHVSIVEKEKCMEAACVPGLEEQIDPTCKVCYLRPGCKDLVPLALPVACLER